MAVKNVKLCAFSESLKARKTHYTTMDCLYLLLSQNKEQRKTEKVNNGNYKRNLKIIVLVYQTEKHKWEEQIEYRIKMCE